MLTDEEANDLGLRSEPTECRAAGIRFVNVAIPDRSVPPDQSYFLSTLQQLVELVRSGRYRVHCRATIGRSSMRAASLLVRLGCDASKSFDAIASAGGCSVPATPEQKQWVPSNVPKG
jgi:protein-tyrosine phosphatase